MSSTSERIAQLAVELGRRPADIEAALDRYTRPLTDVRVTHHEPPMSWHVPRGLSFGFELQGRCTYAVGRLRCRLPYGHVGDTHRMPWPASADAMCSCGHERRGCCDDGGACCTCGSPERQREAATGGR